MIPFQWKHLLLWQRHPWAQGTDVWAWPAWQWRSKGPLWRGWRREALSSGTRTPRGKLQQQEGSPGWGGAGRAANHYSTSTKQTKKSVVVQREDVCRVALTHMAAVPCLLFLCILGKGRTSDPFLRGRELSGRLKAQMQTHWIRWFRQLPGTGNWTSC